VAERRSRGEGGLSWNESRQRCIGRVSVGFTAMGKRRVVRDWLAHGMGLLEPSTVVNRAILARTHLVPMLGRRRLVELTVHDVDAWLADRATMLSTDIIRFGGRQQLAGSPAAPSSFRHGRDG
jgi:hypothetical protein